MDLSSHLLPWPFSVNVLCVDHHHNALMLIARAVLASTDLPLNFMEQNRSVVRRDDTCTPGSWYVLFPYWLQNSKTLLSDLLLALRWSISWTVLNNILHFSSTWPKCKYNHLIFASTTSCFKHYNEDYDTWVYQKTNGTVSRSWFGRPYFRNCMNMYQDMFFA